MSAMDPDDVDVDSPTLAQSMPQVQISSSPSQAGAESFVERYAAGDVLGRGGMGEVWLSKDRRIGRDVALKVMRAGTGSDGPLLKRFLREARVQGQLEHPAIVPVYDVGVDASGRTYFTMKRVRGVTLETVIDAAKRGDAEMLARHPRRRLLSALAQVCLALDFAHRRGVVHRDLKPANLMLGDFGEVYVLDWGVAKVQGAPDPEQDEPVLDAAGANDQETVAGSVLGTLGYMAPEQARSSRDVDPRADIYSLGAVLFELLTFEKLHAGRNGAALYHSTLRGADARPSARCPRADVPPELEAACVVATAHDPADRFATARDLHDAIQSYLDGDRDVALRREMAAKHVSDAKAAMEAGLSDETARSGAMAALGRALALDPENREALEAIVRVLEDEPATLPAEVERELEEVDRRSARFGAISGTSAYASWIALLPLLALMGIREVGFTVVMSAAMLIAAAATALAVKARSSRERDRLIAVTFVTSTIGILATSRIAGPLVLVPSLAAVNALASMVVYPRARIPWAVLALGSSLAIALPFVLEVAGVLPPSYAFDDEGMRILPGLVALPKVPTLALILGASLSAIVIPAFFVGRVRDELAKAQVRLRTQAWHLRQLVPRQ